MKRDILIDCDPGHDDMLAIMVALANKDKLNLLGITTVGGNQTVEKLTQNTLNILSFLNENVPVCSGSCKPLIKELNIGVGHEMHGESGLGGYDLEKSSLKVEEANVVDFLRDKILSAKEKVTIVATAPLTNIAKLLLAYPEISEKIEMISLMGGSLESGNITPHAEFNIWADPEAAKIVFDSKIKIVAAMLEATHKALMPYDVVEELANSEKKVSEVVGKLNLFHSQFFRDNWDIGGVPVHDACSVFYLTNPNMFDEKKYKIEIELDGTFRGKTTTDMRSWASFSEDDAIVLYDVDSEEFLKEMLKVIEYFDNKA